MGVDNVGLIVWQKQTSSSTYHGPNFPKLLFVCEKSVASLLVLIIRDISVPLRDELGSSWISTILTHHPKADCF